MNGNEYYIDITVSEDAEVSAVTRGVTGDKCLDAVEIVQSLIRAKIADSYLTDDYHEKGSHVHKNQSIVESEA